MAEYSFAQLQSEFNTRNRNTDSFVYTPSEVTEALTSAIDFDPVVYKIGSDSTLTTAVGTFSYTPNENFDVITDIAYDYYGTGSEIDWPYTWRYVDGTLRIGQNGEAFPDAKTLTIYGKIKLTHNDAIPDYLVDYVLHNAAAIAILMLISDKAGRFLKNDTTMAELQAAYQTHKQEAQRLRGMMPNTTAIRF